MLIDLRLEHIMHRSETEMLQVRAEEASADESTSIDGVVRVSRNMLGTCRFPADPSSVRVS
jgi:hypothetical protein